MFKKFLNVLSQGCAPLVKIFKKLFILHWSTIIYKGHNVKLNPSKKLFEVGNYADSISLSYYAMFLTTKALLIKKGITPKTHAGLISTFGKEYVREGDFSLSVYR